MISYLPVGCQAGRGNLDNRKSKGASEKRYSIRYLPFDLVEWGSQRKDSHLENGWRYLKLSSAHNTVHCATDPRAMSALVIYEWDIDVEKNPEQARQAQRQARNIKRKRRRARRRISKI